MKLYTATLSVLFVAVSQIVAQDLFLIYGVGPELTTFVACAGEDVCNCVDGQSKTINFPDGGTPYTATFFSVTGLCGHGQLDFYPFSKNNQSLLQVYVHGAEPADSLGICFEEWYGSQPNQTCSGQKEDYFTMWGCQTSVC
jgi:hypothetical protein